MTPTGPIATLAPWGRFGCAWEDLNRWDDHLRAAAAEFGDGPAPRALARFLLHGTRAPPP